MKIESKRNIKFNKNFEEGFSLLEILIALVLMSLALTIVITQVQTERNKLDGTLKKIESAVRFGRDEAGLQGKVTRLHFFVDEKNLSYALETGPSGQFVIPVARENLEKFLSEDEKEELDDNGQKKPTKLEKLNRDFNKIDDFKSSNEDLPNGVKLVGIVNHSVFVPGKKDMAIYFYPSGESDPAQIIFATVEELGILKISPFSNNIEREYVKIEQASFSSEEARNEYYEKKIKSLIEQWQKEKM